MATARDIAAERLQLFINRALAIELALTQMLEARADGAPDAESKTELQGLQHAARARAHALQRALAPVGGEQDERESLFAGIGANLKAVLDLFRDPALKVLQDSEDDFATLQALLGAYVVLEAASGEAGHADLVAVATSHRGQVEQAAAWMWHRIQRLARAAVVSEDGQAAPS